MLSLWKSINSKKAAWNIFCAYGKDSVANWEITEGDLKVLEVFSGYRSIEFNVYLLVLIWAD